MATAQSTIDEVRDIATRWDAAWNAHDPKQLASFFSADATWEEPMLTRPVRGRVEIESYLESMMRSFPDSEVEQQELFVGVDDPSRVSSKWTMRGTFRENFESGYAMPVAATGDRVEFTGVATMTLKNGEVTKIVQYVDETTFQRQIGMLPPPGSRMEKFLGRLQALGASRRRRKNA